MIEHLEGPRAALLDMAHFDLERQHRTAQARHLAHGQLVLRMVRQSGVVHGPDLRVRREILRQRLAVDAPEAGRGGGEIRIRGRLSAAVESPCDRCLEPALQTIEGALDLFYRPLLKSPNHSDVHLEEGEIEISFYRGDGVALEDALREFILLSIPMRVVCRPDCKGLCPICGADRNVTLLWFLQADPRTCWSKFVAHTGRYADIGAKLILAAPFVPTIVGTDTYVTSRWDSYGRLIDEHRKWLTHLPKAAAEAIAWRNASSASGFTSEDVSPNASDSSK